MKYPVHPPCGIYALLLPIALLIEHRKREPYLIPWLQIDANGR